MMRYAYREGWLLRDIFYNAKAIETSSERARRTTLSYLDEQRLLSCLEGQREIEYERKRKYNFIAEGETKRFASTERPTGRPKKAPH